MDKMIEYEGKKLLFEDVREYVLYTDTRGRPVSITNWFPFDFVAEQPFITCLKSFITWWCANRSQLKDVFGEPTLSGAVYSVSMYIDYNHDMPKESLLSNHRGALLDTPLRIIEEDQARPVSFKLVDLGPTYTPTAEDVYVVKHGSYYKALFAQRQGRGTVPRVPDTKWNKKWNYTKKMDPDDYNFYRGGDSLTFGMELEISTKLSCKELQYIVTDVEPKQEPFFIMKEDGSVTGCYDNRVELVTVPCTPRYLRKNWKIFFNKITNLCHAKGKTVHDFFDTSPHLSNGIHIHVGKDCFADGVHVSKFVQVWHQRDSMSKALFHRISSRAQGHFSDNEYCQYSRSYRGRSLSWRMGASRNGNISVSTRHTCCHDSSSSTVEVRIFQGIFDLQHVFRCISFTESIFEFCWGEGFSSFGLAFKRKYTDYVLKFPKYKALIPVLNPEAKDKGDKQCA